MPLWGRLIVSTGVLLTHCIQVLLAGSLYFHWKFPCACGMMEFARALARSSGVDAGVWFQTLPLVRHPAQPQRCMHMVAMLQDVDH